jgi:hypothetical protein
MAVERSLKPLELVRDYPLSLVTGALHRSSFDRVERWVMFVGYIRGHSLVGSLLNAHRRVVIAHQLNAPRYVAAGFRRNQVFGMCSSPTSGTAAEVGSPTRAATATRSATSGRVGTGICASSATSGSTPRPCCWVSGPSSSIASGRSSRSPSTWCTWFAAPSTTSPPCPSGSVWTWGKRRIATSHCAPSTTPCERRPTVPSGSISSTTSWSPTPRVAVRAVLLHRCRGRGCLPGRLLEHRLQAAPPESLRSPLDPGAHREGRAAQTIFSFLEVYRFEERTADA